MQWWQGRVEDLKLDGGIGAWWWPGDWEWRCEVRQGTDPCKPLFHWIYLATNGRIVIIAFKTNMITEAGSPGATRRRVKLLADNGIVVWGRGRVRRP